MYWQASGRDPLPHPGSRGRRGSYPTPILEAAATRPLIRPLARATSSAQRQASSRRHATSPRPCPGTQLSPAACDCLRATTHRSGCPHSCSELPGRPGRYPARSSARVGRARRWSRSGRLWHPGDPFLECLRGRRLGNARRPRRRCSCSGAAHLSSGTGRPAPRPATHAS